MKHKIADSEAESTKLTKELEDANGVVGEAQAKIKESEQGLTNVSNEIKMASK